MEQRTFETSLGQIVLRGRDTGRPILLVLPGLYSNALFGSGIQASWLGLDVMIGRVPGDGAPQLASISIGAFASAYSEAVCALGDRSVFAYGISAGALTALALRGPNIKGQLLIEPPLQTGGLWPLRDALRDVGPEGWEAISWPVFGISATCHEDRDYAHLLESLAAPTTVLVGDVLLEPRRPLEDQPSLVGEAARNRLQKTSRLSLHIIPNCGHSIVGGNPDAVHLHLKRSISSALGEEFAGPATRIGS